MLMDDERDARLKPLNDKLAELNKAVEEAVSRRTKWMDAHMTDFARIQVGEEAYHYDRGRVGRVAEHYRYWAGRDPRYDTSMSIDYRFENGNNTSGDPRLSAFMLCTKEEYRRSLENRAKSLA